MRVGAAGVLQQPEGLQDLQATQGIQLSQGRYQIFTQVKLFELCAGCERLKFGHTIRNEGHHLHVAHARHDTHIIQLLAPYIDVTDVC